jgi:hypothetical protein
VPSFPGSYFRALWAPRGRRRAGALTPREPGAALAICAKVALFGVMLWLCNWWLLIHLKMLADRPVRMLSEASFVLKPGETIEVGRRDLGQKPGPTAAEDRHFTLHHDRKFIWIRNVAQVRRLSLDYAGFDTLAERFEIAPGRTSRVHVDGATITFRNVTKSGFNLEIEGRSKASLRRFTYSIKETDRGLVSQDRNFLSNECLELTRWTQLQSDLRHEVAARFPSMARGGDTDVATLGGQYNCREATRHQIGGVGQLPWRTLKIARHGQIFENDEPVPDSARFFVVPFDAAHRHREPIGFSSWQGPQDEPADAIRRAGFADIGWQVDRAGRYGPLNSIIVGRTAYKVEVNPEHDGNMQVALRPTRNVSLFGPDDCQTDAARELCPYPLNDRRPQQCKDRRCWKWSPVTNVLAQASGSDAVSGPTSILTNRERMVRLGALSLTVVISAFLSGGLILAAVRFWHLLAGGGAARWPHRSLLPVTVTLASAMLALSPEIAAYLGMQLSASAALQFTLANWLLAGAALLWGGAGVLLGLMWISLTILAAIGSTNLASMVIEGDSTRWALYFVKHKYMFLDLVPPSVIAFASCPQAALRRNLQIFVVSDSRLARLLRLVPAIGLALVFVAWLFVGSQTGLGLFQPVEAGKFASIFLAATTLMIFDGRLRTKRMSRGLLPSILSLVALIAFGAILVLVPGLRSDWSPILIMVGVLVGLLAAFGLTMWLRKVRDAMDRQHARQLVPVAFKPSFRRLWYARRAPIAIPALLIMLLAVWALLDDPLARSITRLTGAGHWPGVAEERLLVLEKDALGAGRRTVVERFIAWIDLAYGNSDRPDCSLGVPKRQNVAEPPDLVKRACYVDVELQLIRSRRSIAQGPCGISDWLDDGRAGVATAARAVGTVLVGRASPMTFLSSAGSFCGAAAENKAERDNLKPIRIPVVEKDFSAAYLIGTFGTGAAFLFNGAQSMLIAVLLFAFVRISWTEGGGLVDGAVRLFVAVILAGAAGLLVLQWVLSWSNVLGLLPVMGQPMTFLAYATSHHLFLALPCIFVFVVALRYSALRPYRYAPRDVPGMRRGGLGLW